MIQGETFFKAAKTILHIFVYAVTYYLCYLYAAINKDSNSD